MVSPRYAAVVVSGMCMFAPHIVLAQVQDAGRSSAKEAAHLMEVIQSDATVHDRAMACRRLAVIGNGDAVPVLAKLLVDDNLASYARSGLEGIPHASASAALRESIERLDGPLLVGVLGSIGKRRDARAIDALTKLLDSDDQAVASAAAQALGYIGSARTAHILQAELGQGSPEWRSVTAAACLICANRLEEQGDRDQAMALYDAVCQADVPQHLILAAMHRRIVGKGRDGLRLLNELLGSADQSRFRFALQAARELGTQASGTIVAQLDESPAPRQALLILALGDIRDAQTLPVILEQARRGAKEARIQALRVLGRFDDPAIVWTLLAAAVTSDQDIATAAQSSLMSLQNDEIDSTIVNMLQSDNATTLQAAVVMAGQRNIAEATPALFDLANQTVGPIQSAAIRSLGSTIQLDDVSNLIALVESQTVDQQLIVQEALRTACARLPRGALSTVTDAARSQKDSVQDTATRLLGEWSTADAAPELLDLAKTLSKEKYRVRTLRGYLRIARQLNMTPDERVEVCRNVLAVAERDAEKLLAVETLALIRSPQALALAVSLLEDQELRDSACSVIVSMADGVVSLAPEETEKALRQVLAVTADPTLKQQATAMIEKAR